MFTFGIVDNVDYHYIEIADQNGVPIQLPENERKVGEKSEIICVLHKYIQIYKCIQTVNNALNFVLVSGNGNGTSSERSKCCQN